MTRRKSITAIDNKITHLESRVWAAKEKYEKLNQELLNLRKERELVMGQEIVNAMKKGSRTYREIMTFLGVPED